MIIIRIQRLLQKQINHMSVRKGVENLDLSLNSRACANHLDRAASHQLVSNSANSQMFYCQKCSIMLASQGFTVMKLSTTTRRSLNRNERPIKSSINSCKATRKQEIDGFLKTLIGTMESLERKEEYLQEELIRSENQYGGVMENANSFFKELEEIIELQKYSTYNSILNLRAREESELREVKEGLREYMEEVNSIIEDIRENMDAVETVDYAIYSEIMKGYKMKLDSISEVRDSSFEIKPIETYQISLPDIPQSFINLSESISFFQQQFYAKPAHNSLTLNNSSKSNSKSNSNSNCNSNNNRNILKVFSSERLSLENKGMISEEECEDCEDCEDESKERSFLKENMQDEGNNFYYSDQILKKMGHTNNLGFSFDEQSVENSTIFKPTPQASNQVSFKSKYLEGSSRMSEKMLNFSKMAESKQSLGAYLNLSQSQLSSQQFHRNSVEEVDTLLIS